MTHQTSPFKKQVQTRPSKQCKSLIRTEGVLNFLHYLRPMITIQPNPIPCRPSTNSCDDNIWRKKFFLRRRWKMEKENIFFCGGEEKGRRKRRKILFFWSVRVFKLFNVVRVVRLFRWMVRIVRRGAHGGQKVSLVSRVYVQQLFPPIMKMTPPLGKIIPS